MKELIALLGIAGLLCVAPSAHADTFPSRPIRMVVGYPPGGAGDTVARLVAVPLGEKLGATVIIENKPGAGSIIAASAANNAASDGYTLLLTGSTLLTNNPAIKKQLPYDPLRSFEPLGMVCVMPLLIVANKQSGPASLQEMVNQAKEAPDRYAFGSYGMGSPTHFGGEMLNRAAGLRMVHVPFNGSAPNLTALMGGQIPVAFDTIVAAGPQIAGNKLTALATLSARRLPSLPHVPTVAELGFADATLETWIVILTKAGTPPAIQQKLAQALAEVIATKSGQERIAGLGLIPQYENPSAVRMRVERELPLMRAVAARASIQAE